MNLFGKNIKKNDIKDSSEEIFEYCKKINESKGKHICKYASEYGVCPNTNFQPFCKHFGSTKTEL